MPFHAKIARTFSHRFYRLFITLQSVDLEILLPSGAYPAKFDSSVSRKGSSLVESRHGLQWLATKVNRIFDADYTAFCNR